MSGNIRFYKDALHAAAERVEKITKQRDELLATLLDLFPYDSHKSLSCNCPVCAVIASVEGDAKSPGREG